MSRAFVKEDVDPPERRTRKRSVSGLPPGAINYITAGGAERLRAELKALRESGSAPERVAALGEILGSVEVVDRPAAGQVSLGARVTLRLGDGETEHYTVVGVDEVAFEPGAVSWISPLGKVLLAGSLGERISLPDGRSGRIVAVA
jgi:transcription elongation GreA/GreB family factor